MDKSDKQKKPYSERNDLEKIEANWNKIRGLYNKKEFSSAIVRAATAAEIAANLIVREELVNKRNLEKDFVDNLLYRANGIHGKFKYIILPLSKYSDNADTLSALMSKINDINKERNSVAHSGQFKQKSTAKRIINLSKEVIETLVKPYEEGYKLKGI